MHSRVADSDRKSIRFFYYQLNQIIVIYYTSEYVKASHMIFIFGKKNYNSENLLVNLGFDTPPL